VQVEGHSTPESSRAVVEWHSTLESSRAVVEGHPTPESSRAVVEAHPTPALHSRAGRSYFAERRNGEKKWICMASFSSRQKQLTK
jgi:hypothetical protein